MSAPTRDIVLFPRFTTLYGPHDYRTLPQNVSDAESSEIHVWRGPAQGTFALALEGSLDQQNWVEIDSQDPGEDTEITLTFQVLFPWLRAVAKLGGTGSSVTFWATGWVVTRLR